MRFAVLLLASFLAAPVLSAQHTVPSGGQWLIEPGERSGIVRLTIRYGERRYSDNWNSQDDVPMSQVVGLSAAEMGGSGITVHFKIVRSAGTLTCEGWFDDGKGSGHFTYQPNPDFVAELAKRGINAPPPRAWDWIWGMSWRARSMTARRPRSSRGWRRTGWIWSTSGTSGRGDIT